MENSNSTAEEIDCLEVDDEFEDACESQPEPCSMDLDTALLEGKKAVDCFFNNKFEEARDILRPWASTSMYHSVGHSVFMFLEAVLTFERRHIEAAGEALKQCMSICNKYRRKNTITETIGKIVKKPNYDTYTAEEIHAELCFAEALLLKSMLTFMEDETLVSFIKAGLKIRSCFNSYKECLTILNTRNWINESHKVHFEGGVRMGIGAFNLMISLLPARAIKLLEFIGFSGSRSLGLHELEAGYKLQDSLRQVLSVMTLLGYHLIAVYALSHTEGDLDFCEEILRAQMQLYPSGVWFLFFKGRLEFMKCNIEESISWYTRSWRSQNIWPQFHHLCFWELMWTNCVQMNWQEASSFSSRLLLESRWSRTIYSYQTAAILLMMQEELSSEQKKEVETLMRNAPNWKQRIAGKSLPMEKFAVKKTARFFAQGNTLVLPAFELLYLWNLFKVLGKKFEMVQNVYKEIERTLKNLNQSKVAVQSEYYPDNKALVLLLKAACLRFMKSPLQARECLMEVIALEKSIKEDNYLVPYAVVELAILSEQQNEHSKAMNLLEDAKKNYTGYSLESRLHFKIHAFQLYLNEQKSSNSHNHVPETTV